MYCSFDLEKLSKENPNYLPKNPFEHQKDAFEKMSSLFKFSDNNHKSGILVLPTGAGKTFTSVRWICSNVLTKKIKVLWLANTAHLLVQAYETFVANLLEAHPQRKTINIRVVSSDPEHSSASQIQETDDILIITTQTAISNIETEALDSNGNKRKTAFESFLYNCSKNRLFLVLDEAHHSPAYGCRNLLIGGSKITQGIRDIIPNSYFLGLTATPTYTDEMRRGWLWEIFKDKIIYQADKSSLIKQNILAVPEYIQRNTGEEIEVDDDLYDSLVRQHKDLPDYLIKRIASDSGRNDYIINEYLSNYKTYGKTIIFADRWYQCVYIKENMLKKAKEKNIPIKVDSIYTHIDSKEKNANERNKKTNTENSKILNDFKNNKIDVLINVRMLSEGTDVPDVNTVFITRQTTSKILLTQMIGRALRGKKAGGGLNKETANIVFFVDNWKKVINFAFPEYQGEIEEEKPVTKGHYPLEYISIKLVEDLTRKIENGIVFSEDPFLDNIPIGWYETESLISVDEETNLFTEYAVVFEKNQQKFKTFISEIKNNIPAEYEDDKLDDVIAKLQADKWVEKYFSKEDNISKTLDLDLIKLVRHIAQAKKEPTFYSFDERNNHDLSKIAKDLLEFNEFVVQEKLIHIYNNPSYLWQIFYKSYHRFKTAFDAERNRIIQIEIYKSNPSSIIINPPEVNLVQRELTEQEKEQVFKRDNYICLCCGKKRNKGRRVKFEVDHITPFKFGGETSLNNSQTLCNVCNSYKGVNELNFRVYKTPLLSPKSEIELFGLSKAENFGEVLCRVVNMFYHCQAVSDIKWDVKPRFAHRYKWEIHLYEGNNVKWLEFHKEKLIDFIRNELKYYDLKELIIV
ncbi:MAG TPA: DEAD/DEAH box helicase family protein [Candidatus Kapabacteria bacterium]|nr:DEAD/DEAH box helicase family protein [Candidatus Kapabacteria bacterium]